MQPDGPTLLLVEDDDDTREALVEVLTDAGYLVDSATNGRDAIVLLATLPAPAAIVCDLAMPVMNGQEFVAELRGSPALSSIPVLIMSGAEPTWSDPLVDFLRKPVLLHDLLEAVERIAPRGP